MIKFRPSFFVCLLFLLLSIPEVYAVTFTTAVTPTRLNFLSSNVLLNFTISNTDGSKNITDVNITFPSGFSFVSDSNSTTSSGWDFSSSSSSANWTNTTAVGIVKFGDTQYFALNTNAADTGTYNFTITTLDTDGSSASTNATVTVYRLTISVNATQLRRGDFINITINSTAAPTANLTKPNGTVSWLPAPVLKGGSIYETNYTFSNFDVSGNYSIRVNTSSNENFTNVTMNSTILISLEADKMSSDRVIRSRSDKSILTYGIAKYAVDSSAVNGKTVTVDYSSTTLGTNTTNAAGSYNFTSSIPYDGNYYLNVNISDSYNNTGTNSTNMTIKSRPTYVKYRFSFHLGDYSNTIYRIPTTNFINASLSTSNISNRQYSSNLSHAYVCTYNDLDYSGGMLLALAHSYKMSDLEYVNFSANYTSQTSNYTLELRNNVDNSKLILIYTKGTCELVDSKMYLIEKQTIPTKPMASFSLPALNKIPVLIVAQYDKIQLQGSERFAKGSHRVCIEKPGLSEGNKPLVNISRC